MRTHKRRGCLAFFLMLLFLVVAGGGIVFFARTGIFHDIAVIGSERMQRIPALKNLSSGQEVPMINDKKELIRLVNQSLEKGEEEIVFRTEELDDDFIHHINSCIEAFNGTCENYVTTDYKVFREINMTCSLSNAWYARARILENKEIPKEKKTAAKLARKCSRILKKLELDGLSDYRKEKKIHDYLVLHTVYTTEGDRELLGTAEGPLLHGKGVCSGYARAMKLLCDLSGVTCSTIMGTAGKEDHEWNLVHIDKHWYHVDVTWDDPLPDHGYPMFSYLNLTDDNMAIDHTWERDYYPKADSEIYDYYLLNEAFCEDFDAFKAYMEKALSTQPDSVRVMVADYHKKDYSEDNLSFLFTCSGARKYSYATCGSKKRMEMYFVFEY